MLQDKQVLEEWIKLQQDEGELYFLMIKQGSITLKDKTLKFQYQTLGPKPPDGYSLIFGLHGGGGCTKQVNDQQYKNHLALYNNFLPPGVIWIALRSCEEASDMWWKPYLPDFFSIIIKGFVLKQIVDPNKVFITGYSAGGDGVYHLGPMLADWIAGAAMMAGHPNGVELYNLRNTAFSIQVGANDSAYDRNNLARRYIQTMKELGKEYGGFSDKYSQVWEDCCHWMNFKDAGMLRGFLQEVRNPYPSFILFKQHPRYQKRYFYYLEVEPEHHQGLLKAYQKGNEFHIESDLIPVSIYVNRLTVDYSKQVKIFHNKSMTVCRRPERNIDIIVKTINERMDPCYIFQDCLVSIPTNQRAPFQYTVSDLPSAKPKQEPLEQLVAEEQRRRNRDDACCTIM